MRERKREREKEREREALNSYYTAFKLKPAEPTPSTINCRVFLYSLGSPHVCEKEERSKTGSNRERVKIILVTINRMKEWALLDAILENGNIVFITAVILSAVANGRFVSTMSWQIIAPALVMSLSSVLYRKPAV